MGTHHALGTPQDVVLFFKLHRALMFFVNQRLEAVPDGPADADEFSSLSPEVCLKVQKRFAGGRLFRQRRRDAAHAPCPAHLGRFQQILRPRRRQFRQIALQPAVKIGAVGL